MQQSFLLKACFITSLILTIAGVLMYIQHMEASGPVLLAGIVSGLILTVWGLYEIHSSQKLKGAEKLIWTIGFLLLNGITGLMYFFSERKKIVDNI